ncbi:hypothetical protein BP6252_10800 [Coleophoma cylindrospora]|uniref:Aminotransferase class I/classII large domain-containing protein n=1 Tax=Coleophoma cylindrospora TaxID=1849047 RepID=A0A3D8QN78_9HELO|nr:hypothetical protein BP6252_10800 [Coleophoma cylindrospora]
MGSTQRLPNAIDLSHHLNTHSKSRNASPLKDILAFMSYEGMISLAGGLPHPSLFPFQSTSISTYPSSVVLDAAGMPKVEQDVLNVTITKEEQTGQMISLAKALQYGSGLGDTSLREWARSFTDTVFGPAYQDFEILLNSGNTDGWCKVVRLLCEPGDFVICEQHTYPSAQALWIPMGCQAIPVRMDGQGIIPEELERLMENWEVLHPKTKRPHLLYLVPVGSNPTGVTMLGARRKAIYDACVKFDIIICEDDPYSFLQYPDYQTGTTDLVYEAVTPNVYKASLAPSFLAYDYQGRVIRLDTFSKTLAPGNRLGYFVANPMFTERLTRATEVETQAPSGWSQAIIGNLLSSWGTAGYLQWLSTLRLQYQRRRDWMCQAIASSFDLRPASSFDLPGAEGLIAFAKGSFSSSAIPIFSFMPPTGGMFIWARLNFASSPRFAEIQSDSSCKDPEQAFSDEIWIKLAKALVLVTPGSYYTPWEGLERTTTKEMGREEGIGYFRLAFSLTTKEEMEIGIERMAMVLNSSWGISSGYEK